MEIVFILGCKPKCNPLYHITLPSNYFHSHCVLETAHLFLIYWSLCCSAQALIPTHFNKIKIVNQGYDIHSTNQKQLKTQFFPMHFSNATDTTRPYDRKRLHKNNQCSLHLILTLTKWHHSINTATTGKVMPHNIHSQGIFFPNHWSASKASILVLPFSPKQFNYQ